MNKINYFVKKYPAVTLVLGFQLFRLILLPFMGLMPQDAYYYFYGQHLDWSYLDHPPMIGYMLRFFTEVFGKSVFAIKLGDFIITSLTLWSFYILSQKLLSTSRAQRSLLLMGSTIFISILSFNSTPDVPLLLFWTLSLNFLYNAIFLNKKLHWIFAAITMGFAFNSKYTALLLPIGLFLFLLFSKQYRKKLVSIWPWITFICAALVTFPVWYWNYQHEFVSFLFQSSERTSSMGFMIKPQLFLGVIAHQSLLLVPVLFSIFLIFTFKHIKKFTKTWKLPNSENLFLLAFFIPTFLGFLILSPFYWVKMNWLMPSYVTGVILASKYINIKWLKIQVYASIGLHVLVSLQLIFFLVPIKSDDTWVGWKELSEQVRELKKQDKKAFVFSVDGYKTSAELRFFLNENVYAQNIIEERALQFDYVGDDINTLIGQNAFYIDSDKRLKNDEKLGEIPENIKPYFKDYKELDPIIINKGTAKERKFWVFYCINYQGKK